LLQERNDQFKYIFVRFTII